MTALELRLRGYQLTTAEILYRLPDRPSLLQSYIWQELDLLPDLPVLRRFLAFWERSLDGKLHSVRIAGAPIASLGEIRWASDVVHLH